MGPSGQTVTAAAPALSIGPIPVDPPVVLAPMAGVTNVAFRNICRRFGGGLYTSEMITSRAIVERHPPTLRRASFGPDENPRSIQLYGTHADTLAEATRYLVCEDLVDHIDLNFGCPAPKVTRNGGGAALPFKEKVFGGILKAVVEAADLVPVTIKTRLGIDNDHLTYLRAGQIAEESGIAAVGLHARTAEQLYSGAARWDHIAKLATTIDIPVLGNGDIFLASDALAMMEATKCDGVIVGRGVLGRPWLFADLDRAFAGLDPTGEPTLGQVCDVMVDHALTLIDHLGERGIRDFRKHTGWYLKGFAVGGKIRGLFSRVGSIEELRSLCANLPRDAQLPPERVGLPRGHTSGPKRVVLPDRWLDDPDDNRLPSRVGEGLIAPSGG